MFRVWCRKCKAQHEKSVPVIEMFGDKTVWEGVVESFAITGHPKAKRCYAWSFLDGKPTIPNDSSVCSKT